MSRVAIIGGTGVYNPKILDNVKEIEEKTIYGSVQVMTGTYKGQELIFIPRHGSKHSVPPHLINYRANIKALQQLKVTDIIATAAVGSLHYEHKPGDFVLPDQFLDFTKNRKTTFFEGGAEGVTHCDMTVPYCPEVRKVIEKVATNHKLRIHNGGTYVCTEGPRFETRAEIDMFKQLGGHLVGMTSVPEVCLARELGICYANISIITNFAAGISPTPLTHAEVVENMRESISKLRELIMESAILIGDIKQCDCQNILKEKRMNK